MKTSLLILTIIVGAVYFWPASDHTQELAAKRAELSAREEALKSVDAQIEQWKNEAESKICPTTGQPGVFELKDDPRPKLREEIAQLNQEIAALEKKAK